MKEKIHIGNLIRKKLSENEKSIAWLAKKMCCTRANVYKITKRQHIDTEQLFSISKILDFDFFTYYSEHIDKEDEKEGASKV